VAVLVLLRAPSNEPTNERTVLAAAMPCERQRRSRVPTDRNHEKARRSIGVFVVAAAAAVGIRHRTSKQQSIQCFYRLCYSDHAIP